MQACIDVVDVGKMAGIGSARAQDQLDGGQP
jgi:hypothetical protein